jgi:hypothetical protein
MSKPESIMIDDVKYVPENSIATAAQKIDGLEYVIIRADRAGVFAGYLEQDNDTNVILREARRIYYWDGAATLSQLSQHGVSKPQNCKFPCPIPRTKIMGVIETIPCTEKARLSIKGLKEWAQ